jgi:hypothetical protein
VAVRSKAWVCSRSFVGIAGSSPAGGMDMSVVCFVCCQVEVSATGRSLVQCGVFECDREASIMRSSWPTRAEEPKKKRIRIDTVIKSKQIPSCTVVTMRDFSLIIFTISSSCILCCTIQLNMLHV